MGTLPLSESHIATNTVEWIKDLAYKSGNASKRWWLLCVHDNCKNIKHAGKALEEKHEWFSLGCAGLILQLRVNCGLKILAISQAG